MQKVHDRLNVKHNKDSRKKIKLGAIAQLGERLPCTQEVGGSIPPGSTNFREDLLHTIENFEREMIFLSFLLFNNLD